MILYRYYLQISNFCIIITITYVRKVIHVLMKSQEPLSNFLEDRHYLSAVIIVYTDGT